MGWWVMCSDGLVGDVFGWVDDAAEWVRGAATWADEEPSVGRAGQGRAGWWVVGDQVEGVGFVAS